MNISILGTGQVGATLGKALAAKDYPITYGTRTPDSDRVSDLLADTHPLAQAMSTTDAVAWGDLIIIALGAAAALEVVPTLDLAGKLVADATNNVGWDNGPIMGIETSMGEVLAASQPNAWWVKCFNTMGIEHVLDPQFGDRKAEMLICGDSPEAKAAIGNVCQHLGFVPVDVGSIRYARQLEHLAILWIQMATQAGLGRNFVFGTLRK